jgi:hypothetical protein
MINSKVYENNYTLGIGGLIFAATLNDIVENWYETLADVSNSIVLTNYNIIDGLSKKWLGVYFSYYNAHSSKIKYPTLNNFPYTGGMIIEDFIIGYNNDTNKFITNSFELSKENVVPFNTAFIGTNIYTKFIDSGRQPIVIKSLTYFNGLLSSYNKFYLGKYSNQVSYAYLTFGIEPIGRTRIYNDIYNKFLTYTLFDSIIVEYYYYNGQKWILDTETINKNDPSNYNIYVNAYKTVFCNHQFIFPSFLVPYYNSYLINGIMDGKSNDIGIPI